MFSSELLSQSYDQLDLSALDSLIATLKQQSSSQEEADDEHLHSISGWIIGGWKFIAEHVDRLDDDHAEGSPSPTTKRAMLWARLTRDLLGRSRAFQDGCRPAIDHILKILWLTSAIVRLDHPDFIDFNRFSLQALSNLITLNPISIKHTWALLVNCEERQSVLLRLLYTKDRRLLSTISVLILNSVHQDSERTGSLFRLAIGKKVMTMLLERLEGLLEDDSDVIFEVIVNLVREIISIEPRTRIPELYDSQSTSFHLISPSQLSILKILDSFSSPKTLTIPLKFLITNFLKLLPCSFTQNSGSSEGEQEEFKLQGFVLTIELIVKWIESEVSNDGGGDALKIGRKEDEDWKVLDDQLCHVVTVSVETLGDLIETEERTVISTNSSQAQLRSIHQTKIGILKLLTGLCELKGPIVQDLVRDLNGFGSVLKCTKLDVDRPYLREHALFLIKYLLQNNQANQEFIQKLEPVVVTRD